MNNQNEMVRTGLSPQALEPSAMDKPIELNIAMPPESAAAAAPGLGAVSPRLQLPSRSLDFHHLRPPALDGRRSRIGSSGGTLPIASLPPMFAFALASGSWGGSASPALTLLSSAGCCLWQE